MSSRHRIACLLVAWFSVSSAQVTTPNSARGEVIDGVPLQQIIQAVAARTGQIFIIDPRVNASVKAPGMRLEELTFSDLQSILSVHGYTAILVGSAYKIIPDENVRQEPVPLIENQPTPAGGDDQILTKVLQPRRLAATALATALRPLLPKAATITANASTNSLIVVASAADIRAVEIMMLELEASR